MTDVSRCGFGARFAELRVDADTGEVRMSWMPGLLACGRIVDPTTGRLEKLPPR